MSLADSLSKLMLEFVSLLLLTGNSIFILFWGWNVYNLILKHLKKNPKTQKFYHILSCNKHKQKKEKETNDLEKPELKYINQGPELNANEREMNKIDMAIQHLVEV